MNKIITKLNEIEEKANAILSDAKERQEQLNAQLEREKREIDAKYDRMETEAVEGLKQRLAAEAEVELARMRERNREAAEQLDHTYESEREQLAEEIVGRIIA